MRKLTILMNSDKKHILITGIHGFVGSNLVNALHEHNWLFGLDIQAPIKRGVQKTFNWEELSEVPAVHAIIHLAGKAHDTKNTSSAQSYFDVNLGLTEKIYNYFLESEAEKFIFFSSVKAVADTVPGEVLNEEDIPDPKTPYGQSKLAAEQYILGKKLPAEKNVYSLRPCMIHGPGNKGNLNLLYSVVKKGIPWPLGAFDNRRSMVSIDNLTFIIREILENDIPSGVYQIADNEPISTNELIQLMAQSLDRTARIWHIPKSLIAGTARMGDVLRLPLNSERLQKLTENYVVSNKKISKAIGKPLPVTASEGLLKTLDSFNKAGT